MKLSSKSSLRNLRWFLYQNISTTPMMSADGIPTANPTANAFEFAMFMLLLILKKKKKKTSQKRMKE